MFSSVAAAGDKRKRVDGDVPVCDNASQRVLDSNQNIDDIWIPLPPHSWERWRPIPSGVDAILHGVVFCTALAEAIRPLQGDSEVGEFSASAKFGPASAEAGGLTLWHVGGSDGQRPW